MSIETKLAVLAIASYFLGSVPFGLIIGRLKGIDPRTAGSGNIGATNVGRLLGGKYFALVFTLDLLKGLLPMLLAAWLVRHLADNDKPYLMWMLVGAGSIAGHLFPVYLKFKGGKGVATSAGVLLGLWPFYTLPGLLVVGLFIAVYAITRTVSIGSIIGAGAFPIVYVLFGVWKQWPVFTTQLPLLIFAILVAVMIVWKHRTNIRRLLAGTEHSFRMETQTGEELATETQRHGEEKDS
ncbi:MAG: glycerol-3-phosphate 1-O-acyltransferase PlsY [Burkholderiales bacterium]|nr:glycerol-3-phosphate 1-O-acyltransferase PlsY [Phycisphaerae bacterium]